MATSTEIDLIQNINLDNKDENFVVSPIGLEIVLSLVSNGAQGETLNEILKLLNYKNLQEANKKSKELIEQSKKDKSTLSIATAILTRVHANKEFIKNALSDYDAMVEELKNFHQVNLWAKEKTNNNIVNIIDSISANVLMVLVNAIYFEAIWQTQFDPKNNVDKDFFNLGNEYNQVKTSMLFYRGKLLNYYENNEIQAVKLDYDQKAESIKAIIILPKQKDIDTFIQDFNSQKYDEIIEGLKQQTKINFYLPKFEVEFRIELHQILQNLGINRAFTKEADFKLICEEPLHIGQVLQKNYINVNEKGTQASSVTEMEVILESTKEGDPSAKDFLVNKPFIFMLRNEKFPKGHDILFFTKYCKIEDFDDY